MELSVLVLTDSFIHVPDLQKYFSANEEMIEDQEALSSDLHKLFRYLKQSQDVLCLEFHSACASIFR